MQNLPFGFSRIIIYCVAGTLYHLPPLSTYHEFSSGQNMVAMIDVDNIFTKIQFPKQNRAKNEDYFLANVIWDNFVRKIWQIARNKSPTLILFSPSNL